MKSPVKSVPLRIFYAVVGGLPALWFAYLCMILIPGALEVTADQRARATVHVALFYAGIIGTISGWLTLFGFGVASVYGRAIHTLFIAGGVVAAVFFGSELIRTDPVWLSTGAMAIGASFVGLCLLGHIWNA